MSKKNLDILYHPFVLKKGNKAQLPKSIDEYAMHALTLAAASV